MSYNRDNDPLKDYVEVKDRIAAFREKCPEGSLRPADPAKPYSIESIDGKTFIVVVAAAYRTADDSAPGIGMAWEPVPGTTNFTRNSELQNAETSAWGRAIVAVLKADASKAVASATEVRNRQAERSESNGHASGGDAAHADDGDIRNRIIALAKERGIFAMDDFRTRYGVSLGQAKPDQLEEYERLLRSDAIGAPV